MSEENHKTMFAPAERANDKQVQLQKNIIDNFYSIKPFLDNIPVFILILNGQRQIVFANKVFLDFIGTDKIYGMRPGESVHCIHAWEEKGGCGTSEFCSECGAASVIINSQAKGFDVQECRITQENNDVLDLNIWAKTIVIEDTEFTLFSLSDISSEKRRQVLERIFFHDVLNTVGSLNGYLGMFEDSTPEELEDYLKITERISKGLIDEIKSQRTLTQAENGELELEVTKISTKNILEEVVSLYKNLLIAERKTLLIVPDCFDIVMETDKTILRRIIGNLTKNALEASGNGDTVTLGCHAVDNSITFYVKNPNFIPRPIQLQIFRRSFSTKGTGRGIGTYSIKLLTEKYLKGSVVFTSNKSSGTVFNVTFPTAMF